ncbi:MAG: bifunctional lysylphosphatidylglycerol flippase/synthetase MprF [Bacillota bacterium]|nr:bifunctional lysylphosphatidylglycerol flippase/synthetase MprF [Bacillota bacterium]
MIAVKKEKIFTAVKFIFPLFLLVLATVEINKFAGNLNVHLLRNEIKQLHIGKLAIILAVTLCAVSPMFFYDYILVKILGFEVPKRKLIEQSFIANSFSNLIGFGGIVGAMLRTYFYNKFEQDKRKLLGGIASVSLFYLTGLSLLSWIVAIGFRDSPLFYDIKWLYFAVIGVGFYLPVFVGVHLIKHKKDEKILITPLIGSKLIIVSLFEWIAIFLAIWLTSRVIGISISFHDLLPVFIIASCAGIISMIPGGLGSFDLVFIWGMQDLHIANEKVLVLLLFYRIGYFILPFIISIVLFLKEYWQRWNVSWNYLPNTIAQSISHIILTGLVFTSGLVLLLSASIPGVVSRLKVVQEFISFPIVDVSHQLSVAAGFLLLGLSRGIEYSVKRAYHITMIALSFAALLSIFKGIDYEEAIYMLIVALLLRISRDKFYRESYVMTWGKTIFDVSLILFITSMYLLIGYLNLPSSKLNIPAKLLPYFILDYRDLFNSALFGLTIAFLILLFGYLITKPKKWIMENSFLQEEEIRKHLNVYQGKVLSHLIFLHDKYVFWNSKKNVLFSYSPYADKIVILGDPIGDKRDFPAAIEEFQEIADLHGYTPVFYQVSNDLLPFLHGNGYDFFKLGEEAIVELGGFKLSGQRLKALREIRNKFEREDYTFEIIKPPLSSQVIEQLKFISNEWLQGRKEKGFSLGFFDEDYLNKSEIAVVKNGQNEIMGFVSVMPIYDAGKTMSVDLMRFRPDAAPETIDFIFLSLFELAEKNGYKRFSMGMAPLVNVGLSRFSFLSERIAAQIFLHGHFIYQFQGLRNFKMKFTDLWEPKYLAYRKKSSLPFTMAQITLLISKKRIK